MANVIIEPANANPDTQDWQRALYRNTKVAGGFARVFIDILQANVPIIKAGSRCEVNGSILESPVDENVLAEGTIPTTATVYIYARVSGSTGNYRMSLTKPVNDAMKGGLYNGNDRFITSLYRTPTRYYEWA